MHHSSISENQRPPKAIHGTCTELACTEPFDKLRDHLSKFRSVSVQKIKNGTRINADASHRRLSRIKKLCETLRITQLAFAVNHFLRSKNKNEKSKQYTHTVIDIGIYCRDHWHHIKNHMGQFFRYLFTYIAHFYANIIIGACICKPKKNYQSRVWKICGLICFLFPIRTEP